MSRDLCVADLRAEVAADAVAVARPAPCGGSLPLACVGGRRGQLDLRLQFAQQPNEVRGRVQGQRRIEASSRSAPKRPCAAPSRWAVRRTGAGWKFATSSSSERRASRRPWSSSPPITPASATGRSPEQISRSVICERALDAVERGEALARARVAHDDAARRERRGVEQVVGLADVEHHEVRQVDEQVERPLSDGEQQRAQPRGERLDANAVDRERDVARRISAIRAHRERACRCRSSGSVRSSGSSVRAVDRRELAPRCRGGPTGRAGA